MWQLLLIAGIIGTGTVGAHFFPTEEMLKERFALGQRYYAAHDHANSVQVFRALEATPNFALLNVDKIEVSIGRLTLPIRVAATYQLGNSYRNVGRTLLERSQSAAAEGDTAVAALRRQEASEAFTAGKAYYRELTESEAVVPQQVRVMALYQIIRASYQMEDFAAVVDEAQELLRRFPGSEYEEAALYDRGWAYYLMAAYEEAIATFGELLAISQDVLKADRAIYQSGESCFALGDYAAARAWYRRLVERYDFSALGEKELQEMKTQQLRGLVQETTRELVAKAQIRLGDAYAAEQRVDDAIGAYSQVPELYPQETLLVQKSYDNMASMVLEQQGDAAGIAVLRQAIAQVEDPLFRGRAQLKVARILYSAGRIREAIGAYEVYKKAYGEHAAAIGVPLDQVDFLIAEAYRKLARGDQAEQSLIAAGDLYQHIVADYPASTRLPEALYGLAHTRHGLGQDAAAERLFAAVVERFPQAPVAPFALSWQARMRFAEGDSEGAVELYQRLTETYPGSPVIAQAWKDQGLVFKAMGEPDQALAAFGRVDRRSPLWPKVQAEAGDLLLAQGREGEVAGRFDIDGALRAAAAQGDSVTVAELHYIKGRLARARGDSRTEVVELSAALETSQNRQLVTFCRFFRGLALYELGSMADASGDSLTGRERFQAAVDDLDRVLRLDPGSDLRAVAYRTRGVALTRLGRSAEAVETYRILIASALTAEERDEFKLMLMELYYDQQQLGRTEEVARDLIVSGERGATQQRACSVLVSLLMEQERYEEAYAAAEDALRRNPRMDSRGALMSARARSLFLLERYEEARDAFEWFITQNEDHPDLPSAYYQLGYCHEILGDYAAAADVFRTLSVRFPASEMAADALYRCGENLYNDSRFKDALEVYLLVSRRYPETDFAEKALYSAGWTYMDLGQEEASIAMMERLVESYSGSDFARFAQFSIGDYYYSQKEYEAAQSAYRSVIRTYPDTPEAEKAGGLLHDIEEDLASQEYDTVFAEFDKGNYAEAVRGFEAIYGRHPDTYSALAGLANKAVALEHLGSADGARETYERVLDIAGESADYASMAAFARLRLDNL